MLTVSVTGRGILAETIATCCAPHHRVLREPDPTADVLWICHDVPLDGGLGAERVLDWIDKDVQSLTSKTVVVISSQLPVHSTKMKEARHPHLRWAYVPENIRVATPVADFLSTSRIVVGTRHTEDTDLLWALLSPFSTRLLWTDPETAEMSKHALNAFLALQIAFINEIAALSKDLGVNVEMVAEALLTERRISPNAPLRPGKPFGGGHLARDLVVLENMMSYKGMALPVLTAIRASNNQELWEQAHV